MSSRPALIGLVAEREIRDRFRRRSYFVVTALFVAMILAAGIGARLAGDGTPSAIRAAVVGARAPAMTTSLRTTAHAADRTVHVDKAQSLAHALARYDDDDVDLVIDTDRGRIYTTGDSTTALTLAHQAWAVTSLQTNLEQAGLDQRDAAEVLRVRPLDQQIRSRHGNTSQGGAATGTLAAILLFISLQIFGGQILSGVVEEKSSAVVEVLLARIRADELLAGKVIGVGITALAQFFVLVLAGLAALAISQATIPTSVWTAVPMTLVWYLMGFALYAMLYALAGSLVSRQEDAAGAAAPVTSALVGAYVVLFMISGSPDSTGAMVLSLVPFCAPILMPLRMATGSASILEIVAALVFMAVAIAGVWKFSAKVYSQVLLRRGSRLTWSRALAIGRGAER